MKKTILSKLILSTLLLSNITMSSFAKPPKRGVKRKATEVLENPKKKEKKYTENWNIDNSQIIKEVRNKYLTALKTNNLDVLHSFNFKVFQDLTLKDILFSDLLSQIFCNFYFTSLEFAKTDNFKFIIPNLEIHNYINKLAQDWANLKEFYIHIVDPRLSNSDKVSLIKKIIYKVLKNPLKYAISKDIEKYNITPEDIVAGYLGINQKLILEVLKINPDYLFSEYYDNKEEEYENDFKNLIKNKYNLSNKLTQKILDYLFYRIYDIPLIDLSNLHIDNKNFEITLSLLEKILISIEDLELDLSNNEIKDIPNKLGQFINMSRLDLSNNNLTQIPSPLKKLINMYDINLQNNKIKKIPSWIKNLRKLESINLKNNNLKTLPIEFDKLTKLNEITLDKNNIEIFPTFLLQMPNLQLISLCKNKISCFPAYTIQSITHQLEISLLNNPINQTHSDDITKKVNLNQNIEILLGEDDSDESDNEEDDE